jgi:hypothetical protein
MANILIAGDSWGLGEWGWTENSAEEYDQIWQEFYNTIKGADYPTNPPTFINWKNLPSFVLSELKTQFNFLGNQTIEYFLTRENHRVLHTGLEYYLIESGHSVTNISIPGGSNKFIINTIRLGESLDTFDVIFYFQTDPFRDLRPYTNFKKDFTTYKQLISWQNLQLDLTYAQLNKFRTKIYMLGGCSKLNLSLISKYENLLPLIESIPEFLLSDYNHPEIWYSDWYDFIDRQIDIDSLNKLVYNKNIQDSLANYRNLFWPDGHHPNRFGHKKVFDYINENIFKQS